MKRNGGNDVPLIDPESVRSQVDPPEYLVLVMEDAPHAHVGALLYRDRVLTVDYQERPLSVRRYRWTLIDACPRDTIVVAAPTARDYVVDLVVELDRPRKHPEDDVAVADIGDLHYELKICGARY